MVLVDLIQIRNHAGQTLEGEVRLHGADRQIIPGGFAAHHQNARHAEVHAGGDIGVQTVAAHGQFIRLQAGDFQRILDNAGVGLADDQLGLAAGAGLDEGDDGADIRRKARFGGAVVIGMGGDS